MNRYPAGTACALAALSFSFSSPLAHAAITGGGVTTGAPGAAFTEITPQPGDAIGPDAFNQPDLLGFNEQQGLVLSEDLFIRNNRSIPAGSIISSHYIVFDPADASAIDGFVLFDEPIVAVIRAGRGINNTSDDVGLPGLVYTVGRAIGPDEEDRVRADRGDPMRLNFTAGADVPGDQVRVLTGFVVPEPSTAVGLWLGTLVVLGPRRGPAAMRSTG